MSRPRVAAVLAAHNRKARTLACLAALARQDAAADVAVYLLDDGSTDGTGAAVAAGHPDVTLLQGDGELFWNGGMRRSLARAMVGDHDHYLLLNDDTELDAGALRILLDTHAALGGGPAIVAGAVRDPGTGTTTYGGAIRTDRWRPLSFRLVEPGDRPRSCDTMNANATLVPRSVVERVGNLDPAFRHALGDYDYGLRARAAGCSVWLAPGTVGTCPPNPATTYGGGALRAEWRRLRGTKGLPPSEWRVFAARWAGPLWPVYWLSPYVRRGAAMLRARAQAR